MEGGRTTGNAAEGNAAPPWANPYEGAIIPLAAGLVLAQHAMLCGKDLGVTLHVHPSLLPRFLPSAAEELSEEERVVLRCIRSLISSYRREEAARSGLDAAGYARVVEGLKGRGLLAANGGLTLAGKNAAAAL